jgi:hypothetical protein
MQRQKGQGRTPAHIDRVSSKRIGWCHEASVAPRHCRICIGMWQKLGGLTFDRIVAKAAVNGSFGRFGPSNGRNVDFCKC